MLTRRLLLTSVLPILVPGVASYADDDPPENPLPRFDQIFPKPTGKNGFEEIIRAGERLADVKAPYPDPGRSSPNFGKGNALAMKRTYLADPACRAALSLLRQGMRKPIAVSPAIESTFGWSARLRALSRLLSFSVHVGLADGDGSAVVNDVLGFLRFADTFKPFGTVAGVTGGAIEQIVLAPLIRLRDCWSERGCTRLLTFATNRANAPDPAFAALASERVLSQKSWDGIKAKPEELESQFEYLSENEDAVRAEISAERLRADDGLRARVWGEMNAAMTAYYDRAAALLADPTKTMSLAPPPDENQRFHEITRFLRQSLVSNEKFTVQQAVENRLVNQFLAVHAAIRRYRWQYDRLPKTLEELGLAANLVTDPFTKQPLLYEPEPTGTNYQLASAGALLPGTDGKPDARERFTFPREIRKP